MNNQEYYDKLITINKDKNKIDKQEKNDRKKNYNTSSEKNVEVFNDIIQNLPEAMIKLLFYCNF